MADSNMAAIPALLYEVLVQVFSNLSLQDCLDSCALACRAFKAAAVAAAATIEINLAEVTRWQQRATDLLAWLAKHNNASVQRLVITAAEDRQLPEWCWQLQEPPQLDIPWSSLRQLQSLKLTELALQQAAAGRTQRYSRSSSSSCSSTPLTALTALTELTLWKCSGPGCGQHATQLSVLTGLQELAYKPLY
jgi:hypothetical protein